MRKKFVIISIFALIVLTVLSIFISQRIWWVTGFIFFISRAAFIHVNGIIEFIIRLIFEVCSKGITVDSSNWVVPGKKIEG